ncbi:hypothetical protein AWH48_14860 [Domibacillus aminovorans]|uniref:CYTH domain-containing protein n=1 Tax=Domibacillus aminovorans TaxID=29332 RepID=A0A177L251_9BACI|nr:CYTH domain-containing protein [Domibacillus aminovorans]OAH59417.1 hypothetical protein AWH48_14860 [Domibacillus aminovorans]
MNQEIEIEFKCLLSKEQFDQLVESFHPGPFTTQHNHYFDTADFSLKEAGAALRIREKNGRAEMTLKEPAEVGLLESTVALSNDDVTASLSGGIPDNDVMAAARKHTGKNAVFHFGTLSTTRAEIDYKGGLLVFDHSTYVNQEDYEIEYEAKDLSGEQTFLTLLNAFNIEYIPAENKIRRFYHAQFQNGGH